MGMFDRIYDDTGQEWQTKQYHCELTGYHVGDRMPRTSFGDSPYQVGIIGEAPDGSFPRAFATVHGDRLVSVGSPKRIHWMPLLDREGCLVSDGRP